MGWNNQNVTSLLIVTAGGGFTGVFEYSPAPGAGNLVASMAAAAGTDPYGNSYVQGVAVYGANSQKVAMQVTTGSASLQFFSGAASERIASNIATVVFNRGLVNEQIATFYSGPESTAAPVDQVTMELFDSAANNPGTATGFLQYAQAAGSPPALVQSAQGTSSGGTTTTVTLGVAATLGNTLIVTVQGDSTSGPDPAVTGITIGGVADHFASVAVASGAITRCECWYDPNIGTSSVTVVVTTSAATGAKVNVQVQEWSGLLNPTSADQVSTNPTGAAGLPFTSGTTPGLSASGEIAVGIVATEQTGGTINGPAAPWTNFAQISSGQAICLTGWLPVGSSLSGVSYAGTFNSSPGGYVALVATFKPSAAAGGTRLLPAAWGIQGWGGLLVNKNISTVPASSPAVAETWHNLPLATGFAAGTPTPQYQYEATNGGRVRLRGQVTLNANAVAGKTIATLPVGYRAATVPQTFDGVNNLSGWSIGNGTFQAAAAGVLTLTPTGTSGNVFWIDDNVIVLD